MTAYEREQKSIIEDILSPVDPIKIAFSGKGLTLAEIKNLKQMLELNGFTLYKYTYPVFIFIRYPYLKGVIS